jgi:hypothetical protein
MVDPQSGATAQMSDDWVVDIPRENR